jgi:hypothetical protein
VTRGKPSPASTSECHDNRPREKGAFPSRDSASSAQPVLNLGPCGPPSLDSTRLPQQCVGASRARRTAGVRIKEPALRTTLTRARRPIPRPEVRDRSFATDTHCGATRWVSITDTSPFRGDDETPDPNRTGWNPPPAGVAARRRAVISIAIRYYSHLSARSSHDATNHRSPVARPLREQDPNRRARRPPGGPLAVDRLSGREGRWRRANSGLRGVTSAPRRRGDFRGDGRGRELHLVAPTVRPANDGWQSAPYLVG